MKHALSTVIGFASILAASAVYAPAASAAGTRKVENQNWSELAPK
jgi:hypothetical protein